MKFKILLLIAAVNFTFAFDVYELADGIEREARGEFNQTKNISGFARSIKSDGEFELSKGEFLLRTLKPVQNVVKINAEGVFTLNGGAWIKNERMQDTKLLLNLIRIDVDALKNEFESSLSGDKKDWLLTLTPKSYMLSKIFKSIEIAGGEHVKKIRLIETNGDETINEFSLK